MCLTQVDKQNSALVDKKASKTIIWKAIINTAQPYRVTREMIVETDIKKIHERKVPGIELAFTQNFPFGENIAL